MTIEEFDIKAVRYLNRLARYYAKWAMYDKLPMNLEFPETSFILHASDYINTFLKDRKTLPHYEDEDFNTFIIACAMLRAEGTIKDCVVKLWVLYKKEYPTEDEIKELRRALNNER